MHWTDLNNVDTYALRRILPATFETHLIYQSGILPLPYDKIRMKNKGRHQPISCWKAFNSATRREGNLNAYLGYTMTCGAQSSVSIFADKFLSNLSPSEGIERSADSVAIRAFSRSAGCR